MIEILFILIVLIFVIAPFSLLFHEIGHVVGVKFMKATKILLIVGVGKKIFSMTLQNIEIQLRRLFVVNSFTSTIRNRPFTSKEKMFITMMGPLFSSLLALVAYLLYRSVFSNIYIYMFFLFNLWLFFINLLPFKIGEKQSDGYTIVQIIFHELRN